MNIPEVKIILRCWSEIEPAYNKIEYNLDKLDSMIDAQFVDAYTSNGVFKKDEAVEILTKNLAIFDIGEETIKQYYDWSHSKEGVIDEEDFVGVLKLIARAKINAALSDCAINLDSNKDYE